MRFMIATLILAVGLPAAEARGPVGKCKDQCGGQYSFCMRRSTTKQAQKSCKAGRKICKNQCRG
jgi:hypothetical protein